MSTDATTEAEFERKLAHNQGLDSRLGTICVLQQMREDVFLAQLNWRAHLLNEGFQNRILQILSRYESTPASVESTGKASLAPSDGTSMQFSADLLLRVPGESRTETPSARDSFVRKQSDAMSAQSTAVHNLTSRASTISNQSMLTMDTAVVILDCTFSDGVGTVEVHHAPIKTLVGPESSNQFSVNLALTSCAFILPLSLPKYCF